MEELFKQFTREKQFLLNVSQNTLEGYQWAWKAFEPALANRSCVSKPDVLQRIEELRQLIQTRPLDSALRFTLGTRL
jgi:hypothetical protein